jgi:hypothetical protein
MAVAKNADELDALQKVSFDFVFLYNLSREVRI